jgi:thiosulfate/3-mercaptopyruvate sulfurtransferase
MPEADPIREDTMMHLRSGWRAAPLGGLAFLALCLVGTPAAVGAQDARDAVLMSLDELAAELNDPRLVLLHVGRAEDYPAEHIPGARHVDLEQIAAPEDHEGGTTLSLEMPEPDALTEVLEGLGIGDESRVVVYYADNWVTPATRVVLTLDWIGLGDRTSLLDGGMQRWKEAGHPVTSDPPGPAPDVHLSPRVQESLIVSAEWVRDHLDDGAFRIVDARAPVHYDGIQATNLHREPVRKGHIPGAASIPFNQLYDDQLRLLPADRLRQIFAEAGVEPGQTVVGYCHLGQFATAMLFAARTLGHPVRLYDGSFQEWGSREELPVQGPDSAP